MAQLRWLVSQFGAREHYAVPRAFHRTGTLQTLYTDSWCHWGRRLLHHGPGPLRTLANRSHPELRSANVVSFTSAEIVRQCKRRLSRHRGDTKRERYLEYLEMGELLDCRVEQHLRSSDLVPENIFFGFANGSLASLRYLKSQGLRTIVDQIDPAKYEDDLVLEEADRWPGWQRMGEIPKEYYDRLAAEWDAADFILVNSTWTKRALLEQGVPVAKIRVVPLAYEPSLQSTLPERTFTADRLQVLWLGSVDLRKGIQYLLGAARKLQQAPVDFTVAGPINLTPEAVASAPPNVQFVGQVARDQIGARYAAADLFVLPTISDGFAITQLEAMAHGLPVIATPNCGEVVTSGVDGWIVPARDGDALAAALLDAHRDRERLRSMSQQALSKSRLFTLERYRETVERFISIESPSAEVNC